MKKNIISIQSQVASGYVGNNIAGLAIQLHMLNVVQVPTVMFSNHVEYPSVYGSSLDNTLFRDLLKGITINGFVDNSEFLISGFCDNKANISALADFISNTKQNAGYKYVYDPVFGDHRAGGLYLEKTVADHSIAQLLHLSDIITPNHFELEYILSEKLLTETAFRNAIARNSLLASKIVVATGVVFEDSPENSIEVILYKNGTIQRFPTARIPMEVIGAGDLFTAIMVSQLQLGTDIEQAINTAIDYLNATIMHTYLSGYNDFNAETILRHAHLFFDEVYV